MNKKQIGIVAGIVAAIVVVVAGVLGKDDDPGKLVDNRDDEFIYNFDEGEEEAPKEDPGQLEDSELDGQAGEPDSEPDDLDKLPEGEVLEGSRLGDNGQKDIVVKPGKLDKKDLEEEDESQESGKAEKEPGQKDPDSKNQDQTSKTSSKDQDSEEGPKKPSKPGDSGQTGQDQDKPDEQTGQDQPTGGDKDPDEPADDKETEDPKVKKEKEKLLAEKPKVQVVDGIEMPMYSAYDMANRLNQASPGDRAQLGTNPVSYYYNPDAGIYLDIRTDINAASKLQAIPIQDGFLVLDRHFLQLWGMDPTRLSQYLKDPKLKGVARLSLVSEEEKKEMEEDKDLATAFKPVKEEEGSKTYIAAFQDKDEAERMTKVLTAMGTPQNQLYQLKDYLNFASTEKNTEEMSLVGKADNRAEWEDLKQGLKDNPADIEWSYNFPLYADHDNYHLAGGDLRQVSPSQPVSYKTATADLDGDGFPEYIVHAIPGVDEDQVEGYWAIMAPSPQGLLTVATSPYGNGDFFKGGETLYFSSLAKKDGGYRFTVDEAQLPLRVRNREPALQLDFKQPEGLLKNLTGKDLAEKYPDHYLLSQGEEVYLVSGEDFDHMADYLLNGMKNLVRLDPVDGQDPEEATGHPSYDLSKYAVKDQVTTKPISDPLKYIANRYSTFPFSQESWDKAVAVDDLKDVDEVISLEKLEDLQKGN